MIQDKSNTDKAVIVRNIHKSFRLPHESHSGVKQLLINFFNKNRKKGYEIQNVLKGVSFEIEKGEFFGIVGRNGSGKSTLLKLLAGIYVPEKGSVEVDGNIVPFIELGVGFNPELTGRDNVFLNGALLGFSKNEMEAMYDDIVGFAELERFMDQKLKNYSSGMQVRLAFSIAIKAKGDVLILDEVLAVGDEAFQRKCNLFFDQIKKDKTKTVVLVTHGMDAVRKYCDRAILIRGGEMVAIGSPDAVADEYSLENLQSQEHRNKVEKNKNYSEPLISAKIKSSPILKNTDVLEIEVRYRNTDNRTVYPKVVLMHNNTPIMAANGKLLYGVTTNDTKQHVIKYKLPLDKFNKGEVRVGALLVDSEKELNLADFGYSNDLSFIIKNAQTGDKIGGIMRDLGTMELDR